jgi:hypothetical protein
MIGCISAVSSAGGSGSLPFSVYTSETRFLRPSDDHTTRPIRPADEIHNAKPYYYRLVGKYLMEANVGKNNSQITAEQMEMGSRHFSLPESR